MDRNLASLSSISASPLGDEARNEPALTPEDLWLGKAAPRYTSYPPASVFKTEDSAAYVMALSSIPDDAALSLYVHVPFCKAVCLYCGCNTCASTNELRVLDYVKTLGQEAKMVSQLGPRRRKISRLHFGGGSPNILSEKAVDELFLSLDARFDLKAASEIAMEMDPRLITFGQAAIIAACGVTRVSLGVQDFNPGVQNAIGRHQPFALVERAVDMLRSAGIPHISLDLMYGLPLQTPAGVAETARLALSLNPDRVSLFSYAHVPQFKKHQAVLERYGLPDPYLQLSMEQAVRAIFREAGYAEIGMDHFAKPVDSLARAAADGKLHRNFQGYTDDQAKILVGLGASSIGFTGGGYYQNNRDTAYYQKTVAAGRFAVTRGLRLSGDDRVRAAIIERLMCDFACDLEAVCHDHNYALASLTDELAALDAYRQAGLIAMDGYKIRLTSPYRMAIRVIAQVFDKATRDQNVTASRVG